MADDDAKPADARTPHDSYIFTKPGRDPTGFFARTLWFFVPLCFLAPFWLVPRALTPVMIGLGGFCALHAANNWRGTKVSLTFSEASIARSEGGATNELDSTSYRAWISQDESDLHTRVLLIKHKWQKRPEGFPFPAQDLDHVKAMVTMHFGNPEDES